MEEEQWWMDGKIEVRRERVERGGGKKTLRRSRE